MHYPCGKFDDCSVISFGFIVRADKHTDTQTPLTLYYHDCR